jgi:AhpD family alkylhydroperoxidase
MENQLELNEERMRLLEKFKQNLPEVMDAEYKFLDLIYKDGALSVKMKRLLALAIALRAGCTNCIIAQTKRAIDAGATKEEVLETLAVEVAMSGTTGIAESLRVIKLMEEMNCLD